ncbi:MAG: AraC family transcriptional regulator [Polyangiaceae bacterium]|nr:AraC family transcriptional regulator [Polyangiaceae bacterium]
MSSPATAPEPTIPAGYAREVVELAAELGVDRERLVADVGIGLEALSDPGARLPIPTCEALVVAARARTGQPALAVLLGLRMRVSQHGFLGFAAMTAGTVRQALALAERYCVTRTTALSLTLYEEGEAASVVIEERAPLGELREFAVLSLVSGLQQIGQALTGRALTGRAECGFPEPDYVRELVGEQRALLRFGCPSNRLVFSRELLSLPLLTADPVAMELARTQCERELSAIAASGGLLARVRAALDAPGRGFSTLEDVAAALHASPRTLERHLAAHGTTFSALLDTYRRERALLLADDRTLSVAEIAWRVGYSDVANFTRAFRRWTGRTPGAYRRG